VNEFGLRHADFYRSGEVAKLLKVTVDVLRWRLRTGRCPESARRDAKGRLFTLNEIRALAVGVLRARA
jgi:hypothetical protein